MIVQKGRLKGKNFYIEGSLEKIFGTDKRYGAKDFNYLVMMNLPVAIEAFTVGKYDLFEPNLYYGNCEKNNYIISHEDLYGEKLGE